MMLEIISETIYENVELFRIMPLERFLQMLYTGKNVLVRPSMWEDPYEKVIRKSVIKSEDKEIPFDETRWYGQCWSKSKESDGLWRVFTKNSNSRAVKIKTDSDTIKKSLNYIENSELAFFLESVKYPEEKSENLKNALVDLFRFDWLWENGYTFSLKNDFFENDPNVFAAPMLLTKRYQFKHEEEVRLLCYSKKTSEAKTFEYDIKWMMPDFIKEVVLDPWTPEGLDVIVKDIIGKYCPNNDIKVTKSDLYKDVEKGFIFHIG